MKIPIDYKTMLINNVLAVQITSELSLKAHIDQIAKSASRKQCFISLSQVFFSADRLLKLYIGLIHSHM